nr:hypothetical protein [uncultured Acetatifactor sp.]
MVDDYTNELTEVNCTSGRQPDELSYETTAQMMQNFASTIIGLSQQMAENNGAKYRAQAEVMIANIQATMQAELQDVNGYYNTREKQEENFNKIITSYQEQFKALTNQLISEENETKAANMRWAIERLQSAVGEQMDQLAKNITCEQNTRLETSNSRNRGLFGLFKRR